MAMKRMTSKSNITIDEGEWGKAARTIGYPKVRSCTVLEAYRRPLPPGDADIQALQWVESMSDLAVQLGTPLMFRAWTDAIPMPQLIDLLVAQPLTLPLAPDQLTMYY